MVEKAAEPAGLSSEMVELEKFLAVLDEEIALLGKRLAPILRPPSPPTCSDTKLREAPSNLCAVAQSIAEARTRLGYSIVSIRTLTSTLDI
jgi:hypothetical protein